MTVANISVLNEHINDEKYQEEDNTLSKAEKSANSELTRFPNVESVLNDIDAFSIKRGLVA